MMHSQPKLMAKPEVPQCPTLSQKIRWALPEEQTLQVDFRLPHACAHACMCAHKLIYTPHRDAKFPPLFQSTLLISLSFYNCLNCLFISQGFASGLNFYILFFYLFWAVISPYYPCWFQSGGLKPFSCVGVLKGNVLLLREDADDITQILSKRMQWTCYLLLRFCFTFHFEQAAAVQGMIAVSQGTTPQPSSSFWFPFSHLDSHLPLFYNFLNFLRL